MSRTHDGKVAIVTGSGRGLGRAMGLGLLGAGAKVVFSDVDADVLDEAARMARQLGGDRVEALTVDVAQDAGAVRLVRTAIERFGRIDILVNNAGTSVDLLRNNANPAPGFWDVTPAEFRRVVDVNTVAPFLLTREAAVPMRKQGWGRVINVTTSLDTMYRKGLIPYGGSKAANEAHCVAMAEDLRGSGVTVNVMTPGGPANTRLIPPHSGLTRDKLIPPEIMVAPLLWLTSDAAGEFTGWRFVAAKWDSALAGAEAARKCGAPAAWQQLGPQAIYPAGQRPG